MEVKEKKVSEEVAVAVKPEPTYFISPSNMSLLRACVVGNAAALLIGETGTGKTTVVREIAKEAGKELIRISVNGSMGVEEILGKWLVNKGTTVWQDGVLTMAMRAGHWVVMDEINAALPEILFVLHSLLDDDRKIILPEKDNEIVKPHEEFRFFATMNPTEEYAGTKDMNKALMSRFTAVINVDVLDNATEVRLLVSKGADKEIALNLVNIATKLREYKKKDYIFYFASTRDLVQAVQLINAGLSFQDALLGAIGNKMSSKELELVRKEFGAYFKLDPSVSSMTIDRIFYLAQNYEKDLKQVKDDAKKQLDAKDAEMKRVIAEAKKSEQDSSDKVRQDILEKLAKIAKS